MSSWILLAHFHVFTSLYWTILRFSPVQLLLNFLDSTGSFSCIQFLVLNNSQIFSSSALAQFSGCYRLIFMDSALIILRFPVLDSLFHLQFNFCSILIFNFHFHFQLSFSFSTFIFIFNSHFHCPLVQFLFSSSGCIFCFCSNLNFILWQLHVSILRKDHQCSHLYCWIFEILLAPVLNLGSSDDLGRYLSIWAIWAQAEMFKFSVTRRRICLVPNPLRKVATGLPQYCSAKWWVC